jgi:CRISPR/Cas system CSM-associated protein Csm3 (group 7 of RAMP superfamily)
MARRRFEPTAPKPYGFVPLPEGRIERKKPAGHATYQDGTVSGVLRGALVARTPIHVASGQLEMADDPHYPLVKAHVRSIGRPVVPGSSLKGCIRSIVEAITPSCVRITRAKDRQLPDGLQGCSHKESLCLACRMFGSLGYQGLVRFSDAVLTEGETEISAAPPLYMPRGRERRYFRGGMVAGRKFYQHGEPAAGDVPLEVCPEGSRLEFTLHFDNLRPAELGVLLLALGQGEPRLYPKLGGAKPACRGSAVVEVTGLEVFEDPRAAYASYGLEAASVDIGQYLDVAKSVVLPKQLEQLASILRFQAGRQCPAGNY